MLACNIAATRLSVVQIVSAAAAEVFCIIKAKGLIELLTFPVNTVIHV